MNISNHCFQRYHERVREKNTPFVDNLKERYTKELSEFGVKRAPQSWMYIEEELE